VTPSYVFSCFSLRPSSSSITTREVRALLVRLDAGREQLIEQNEQLQAAVSLQAESETKLDRLFQNALAVLVMMEIDSLEIVRVSPAVQGVLGWETEQIIGRPLQRLIAEEYVEPVGANDVIERLRAGEQIGNIEINCKHRDGRLIPLTWNLWRTRDYVYGAGRDLSAQRAAEQQAIQLEAQEQALKMQERFIATMYHELRTPLAVMTTSTELVRDERLPAERKEHHMSRISQQIERMTTLVNETLRLRRIIDPAYPLTPEVTDLVKLVENIVTELDPVKEKPRISLEVGENLPKTGVFDTEIVHHSLVNVLSNALKYSDKAVTVRLSYEPAVAEYHISVQDRGIGIAATELTHIFEPFYRSERAKMHEGSGLGLAIAADAIRKHGGDIRVESERDAGTTFYLTLPPLSNHTGVSGYPALG